MKGQSTIGTYLSIGEPPEDISFPIKAYPDIGGSPDLIEVTDQDDESRKNVPGVKSSEALEFLMNYTDDDFWNLSDICENGEADLYFELKFGANGEHGKFQWTGRAYVRINGGDVNSARKMTLSVYPDGDINDTAEMPEPSFTIVPSSLSIDLEGGPQLVNIEANWETGVNWINWDDDVVSVEPIGNGRVAKITPLAAGSARISAHPQTPYPDPDYMFPDPECDISVYVQPRIWIEPEEDPITLNGGESVVLTRKTNVEPESSRWLIVAMSTSPFTADYDSVGPNQVKITAKNKDGSAPVFAEMTYGGETYSCSCTIRTKKVE